MARKNIAVKKILTAQDLSADFQSIVTNVDYLDNVGVIIKTSGVSDNTGSFGIQVRIKNTQDDQNYSDWSDLTLNPVPTLADTDTDFNINLKQVPFSELRVVFAVAGGTPDGTCDVWLMAKQVGG